MRSNRGWKKIKGFQLRYIYLIDKKKNNRSDNSAKNTGNGAGCIKA